MENVGSFIYQVLRILVGLPSKIYEMLTYEVDISWLSKILGFFGAETNIPNTISLLALLGSISAVVLVGIIIYNIFKPWGIYASSYWGSNENGRIYRYTLF